MCSLLNHQILIFQIRLEYPKSGWVEINPDVLWEQVIYVMKGAVQGKF